MGWKIFISYLVVILVLIIVIVSAAMFVAPSAFDRHLTAMEQMTMEDSSSDGEVADLEADLFENFRVAINESLRLATIAAFIAAVTVSIFVSRRIVAPIRDMMNASQRIADGHYDERVDLPGGIAGGDTDELGQLALSFNQMAEKLEHTEEMRRQLIGDVAHELRTPLTTIQGSMEGLIDGILPADEETYQNVYREASRLQKLVRDLQELSRVEDGVALIEPKPVKISELSKIACSQLERQYLEKGVELIDEVEDDLPLVMADEDRIGQVLLNLLGNGLQYTPTDGWVRITARRLGEFVEISVEDSGIGIDPEDIPHLFTRFYRVDKSRSRVGGGSGIGLTIAKHLVETSGGRIWVKSSGVGKGSTFSFTLPLVK
ncbi:MAG: HAMP domain-containing protein [Anaerolineales bacterium]|nr:HAMP domain-containing protein [Anaerolineales bacterium]